MMDRESIHRYGIESARATAMASLRDFESPFRLNPAFRWAMMSEVVVNVLVLPLIDR